MQPDQFHFVVMEFSQPYNNPSFAAVEADGFTCGNETIHTLIPPEKHVPTWFSSLSNHVALPITASTSATRYRLWSWFLSPIDVFQPRSMPLSSTNILPRYQQQSHSRSSTDPQPYKVGSTVEKRYSSKDLFGKHFRLRSAAKSGTVHFNHRGRTSSGASQAEGDDAYQFDCNGTETETVKNHKNTTSKERDKSNRIKDRLARACELVEPKPRSRSHRKFISTSPKNLHTSNKRSQQGLQVNPDTLLISNYSHSNSDSRLIEQQQHNDLQRQKPTWSFIKIGSADLNSDQSIAISNLKSPFEFHMTNCSQMVTTNASPKVSSITDTGILASSTSCIEQATTNTIDTGFITSSEIRNTQLPSKIHPYSLSYGVDPLHGSQQKADGCAVAGRKGSQTLNPKQVTTLEIIEFDSANVFESWGSQICTQIKQDSSESVKRINSSEPVSSIDTILSSLRSTTPLQHLLEHDLEYVWQHHFAQTTPSSDKYPDMWPKQSSRFKLLKSHQAAAGSSSNSCSSGSLTSAEFELHGTSSESHSSMRKSKSAGSSPLPRSHKSNSFFQKGRSLSDSSTSSTNSSKSSKSKISLKSSSRSLSVSHRSRAEKVDPAYLESYYIDNPYEIEDNKHKHHSSLDSILPPPPRHDQHFISRSELQKLQRESVFSSAPDRRSPRVPPMPTHVSPDPARYHLISQRSCHNVRSSIKMEASDIVQSSMLGVWGSAEKAIQSARDPTVARLSPSTPPIPFSNGTVTRNEMNSPPRSDNTMEFSSDGMVLSEPETPHDQFYFEMASNGSPTTLYRSPDHHPAPQTYAPDAPDGFSDFCFIDANRVTENGCKSRLRSYYDWADIDANIDKIQASFQSWDQEHLRQEIEEMLEVPQLFMMKNTADQSVAF